MVDWVQIILLLVFGMAGGFLAGLLGIGGGIIYVFVLRYYFRSIGLDDEAIAPFVLSNSISATFFAGFSGTIKQIQKKNFYLREVLLAGSAGVISGLLITWSIVQYKWYTDKDLTYVLILVMPLFLYQIFKKDKRAPDSDIRTETKPVNSLWYILAGIFTGGIASLAGLGGGVIMIPILTAVLGVHIRKASSISLGIIPMQAMAMGIYYATQAGSDAITLDYSTGYIVWPVLLPLVVGVVAMAPFGVKVSHKLSPKLIKTIFTIVVGIILIKLIFEAFGTL